MKEENQNLALQKISGKPLLSPPETVQKKPNFAPLIGGLSESHINKRRPTACVYRLAASLQLNGQEETGPLVEIAGGGAAMLTLSDV